MKRIILAVIFGVASLSSISTKAQVSLNINIGSQPQWGPTGYDHVDYYYLPDVDAYYNVPAQQYVYLNNGSWIWRNSLPSQYSNFDLYNSYKVVMNTPKPYLSHQTHVREYSKYKGTKGKQGNIRDSKDARYVNARNNNGRGNTNVRTTTVRNTTVRNNTTNRNTPAKNNNAGKNNGKGNDNRQDNRGGRGH
ncbi:MAG: hypothetical protein ABWY16_04715 [Pedobacter sp.]|uniref:hypothetical protein n=1 Tax=Pedobacter sp. TaxID=1411316 RepID=UPI0033976B26